MAQPSWSHLKSSWIIQSLSQFARLVADYFHLLLGDLLALRDLLEGSLCFGIEHASHVGSETCSRFAGALVFIQDFAHETMCIYLLDIIHYIGIQLGGLHGVTPEGHGDIITYFLAG